MAAPMTPTQWRAQMRKWLVPYKEHPDWTTNKRPGSFSPVGITIHHTGSDSGQNSASYDRFLFDTGRPAEGIPAPLCQSACEMDGDIILGAIGRANHAGSGNGSVLAGVKAGTISLTREIRPGADNTNGNGWLYGLEVKFDGGQPMTPKQYDSAVRWAAAICDFYGWSAGHIIGHKEWSSRKPDPGHTLMAKFRRDVAARLKAGPGGTPTGPVPETPDTEEAELMGAKEDIIAQINAVSGHLADNNRQWANNILAEVTRQNAELNARVVWLESRVQAYAAFGAKHTDQVEATTASDVQAILSDEFAGLASAITAQTAAIAALVEKLTPAEPEEPEAPKA
jgi:hypothetical protein